MYNKYDGTANSWLAKHSSLASLHMFRPLLCKVAVFLPKSQAFSRSRQVLVDFFQG